MSRFSILGMLLTPALGTVNLAAVGSACSAVISILLYSVGFISHLKNPEIQNQGVLDFLALLEVAPNSVT